MSDHDHTDPLVFAVAMFERWREQRADTSTRVPLPLRQIACRLLDVEPRAHVARSLQIAEATFGRWQAQGDGQRPLEAAGERRHAARTAVEDNASPPITFVALPVANECAFQQSWSAVPAQVGHRPQLTREWREYHCY